MFTTTLVWAYLLLPMAEKFTQAGNYDLSAQLLESTSPGEDPSKYYFLKASNAFAMNDRKKTLAALEDFEFVSNSNTPGRYRHIASLMRHEANQWKDMDLGDIGRDMKHSADRLNSGKADDATKKIQSEIVAKLDKLIKEEQDARDEAKKKKPKPGEGDRIIPGNQTGDPKDDSDVNGIIGDGAVDPKKFRKIADNWGSLPEAARAKVMNDIQRDIPPKYRQQIEEYFKSLNRR